MMNTRERARDVHALLRGDAQQAQRVEAVDVLERGEVLAAHLAEVEHLDDLRVGQLRGQLRLVDEHRDEVRVGRQVRQDPLDDQDLLEAVRRADLGAKHLGHAADGQPFEQRVAAKGRGRACGCPSVAMISSDSATISGRSTRAASRAS